MLLHNETQINLAQVFIDISARKSGLCRSCPPPYDGQKSSHESSHGREGRGLSVCVCLYVSKTGVKSGQVYLDRTFHTERQFKVLYIKLMKRRQQSATK